MSQKIVLPLALIVIMLLITNCNTANIVTPLPSIPSVASPSPDTSAVILPTITPVAPLASNVTSTAQNKPTPLRTPLPTPTPFDPSNADKIERDIIYCNVSKVALKLDLYFPKKPASQPLPVAVNIHGGSWSLGDKQNSDSAADIPEFISRGYLVAALNYRLAPTYPFPSQIEDVKCAIRFLRANAKTYNLDPNRMGAWGCSAGGQLAALLGLTDSKAGFDVGEYANQSSRIQVVATLSAPMDITLYDATARGEMLKKVFGTSTDAAILAKASPSTYVSKNAPPFLLFQGNRDNLITPKHGEKFVEQLTAVGGSGKLITVENGAHCFPPDSAMTPNRAEISTQIVNFFDQHLR